MLRVCLVCLPAASVVDPARGGAIGGTETRAWLFARSLAKLPETQVTFAVRGRTPLPDTVDGVVIRTLIDRVFSLYEQVGMCVSRTSTFPWLQLKQWRWPLLWQFPAAVVCRLLAPVPDPTEPSPAFQGIACDVFCTFGVQTTSAAVIASAHATGRKCLLVLGSDGDLDPKFLTDPDYVNPYGDRASVCRFILAQADAIVCQTADQQRSLKERFGRDGVVVENPIDLEDWDRRAVDRASSDRRPVLWVGRAESIHKRPMLAVELAKRCPELSFVLVMNPRDPAEEARVRAGAPSNVVIRDFVPPPEMPALMSSALVMLNTSSLEGFPNTFLQAGASRVPVIALEVGDRYLRESRGGVYCEGDLDRAAAAIRQFAANEAERKAAGERGRAWVEKHHASQPKAIELWIVLSGVSAGTTKPTASPSVGGL